MSLKNYLLHANIVGEGGFISWAILDFNFVAI